MNSSSAPAPLKQGLVIQPDEGKSFWQPTPANGYITIKLSPENWDGPFSMGMQSVAPGSYIRQHSHDKNHEVVFVWQGRGTVIVEGQEHPMVPGTFIALPTHVEHLFRNDSDTDDMKLVWLMAPHGLEDFFSAVGRPRIPGEPAPPNFARPDNVLEIEARTVFKPAEPAQK